MGGTTKKDFDDCPGDSKQDEDGERRECVSPQEQGPGDKKRDEETDAVQGDDVEIVGRSGNVCLTDLDAQKRSAVGHGGGDGFFDQGEESTEKDKFYFPIETDGLDCRNNVMAKPPHESAAKEHPEKDEPSGHADHRTMDRAAPGEEQDKG